MALLLGVVGMNDAFGAYLPKLGASSLRFQSRPLLIATFVLPPLKMGDEVVATNGVDTNVLDHVASMNGVSDLNPEPLGPPAPPTLSAGTWAPVEPPPVQLNSSPVVTPQMLLQFFPPNPAGTHGAAGLIVPGQFQLPQPPSSSATYNSK